MDSIKHIQKITPKPFVKWAGGKRNLLKTLELQLPKDFDDQVDVTYIEPFVGGGAMMFHMINTHQNIKRAVINDINRDLVSCFMLIKKNPAVLIDELMQIEKCYKTLSSLQAKKEFYLESRDNFNKEGMNEVERAANFIFLNHTCFNGLYRENRAGKFNVPFGNYINPTICNEEIIMADHQALSKVDIYCKDYQQMIKHLGHGYNFVYLDPPYRPLLGASNFKEYASSGFSDKEQQELKVFCDKLTSRSCKLMISNSDSINEDGSSFFEKLFEGYIFGRVYAPRIINALAARRHKLSEVLIKNYNNSKKPLPKKRNKNLK